MVFMRTVSYRRWNPRGGTIAQEKRLSAFLQEQAYVGLYFRNHRELPSLQEINEILLRGSGDDGFIGMTWEPFEITPAEYREVVTAFGTK